jgi:hypothetical protein
VSGAGGTFTAITGGAGVDTITTGSGAATVTGAAGNDVITLTAHGTNVQTIVFADTATNNGVDAITGFVKTTDTLNLSAFENAVGDEVLIAAGAITTTASRVYYLGGLAAGADADTTAAAAAITAGATWTNANVTAWVVLSDTNSTSIYSWTDATTDAATAGELTLVATIGTAMSSTELATAITVA